MEVPQFMDRHSAHIPKSQIGFLKVIVTPMFELCARILPRASDRVEQIGRTIEHWAAEVAKDEAAAAAAAAAGGAGAGAEKKEE